eukprot:tig00020563_g11212.t1
MDPDNDELEPGAALLLAAVEDDDEKAVELLDSEIGSSLQDSETDGRNVIHVAAQYGSVGVLKTLITRGTSADTTCEEGSTPLHWAAREGRDAAVRLLLSKGANLELCNARGQTCLHSAVIWGHASVAETILRHPDSSKIIDVRDTSGCAALHWAVRKDQPETVKLLLLNGANARLKDAVGQDAAALAVRKGKKEIAEILLSRAGKSQEEIRTILDESAGMRPRPAPASPTRRTRAGTMNGAPLSTPWAKWEQLETELEEEKRRRIELTDKLRKVEDERTNLQAQLVRAQEQCRQAEQQFANERLQKKNEWSFYERKFLELQAGVTASFRRLPDVTQSDRALSGTPTPLPPRPRGSSPGTPGSVTSEEDLHAYIQDLHRVIEAFQDLLQANSRSKNDEISRLERQVQDLQRQLASALDFFKEPTLLSAASAESVPVSVGPPTPRSPGLSPAASLNPGPLPARLTPVAGGARANASTPRSLFSSEPADSTTPRTTKRPALPPSFDLVGCFRGMSPRSVQQERPVLRTSSAGLPPAE